MRAWLFPCLVLVLCATAAHGARAKENSALSRSAPVALPRSDEPVAPVARAIQSAQLALVASYLKVVIEGFTPAEQWLRRFIGGGRKQRQIWAEYCRERDQLIAQVAAGSRGRDARFKAVVLERLVLDLRSEFKVRYPAWALLWE